MDYNKIGKLIAIERKAKKLTLSKLAEKLSVSEKTISNWEKGNGIPDTNTLPILCEILQISVNELLNGERISSKKQVNIAENNLTELQKSKEKADKILLSMEIVIGLLSITLLISLTLLASFLNMENWLRLVIITFAFVVCLIGLGFSLKIEQLAGYYVCKKCGHKHIPTYKQVFFAMHIGRTRYLQCPHCKQKSWNKKVVK